MQVLGLKVLKTRCSWITFSYTSVFQRWSRNLVCGYLGVGESGRSDNLWRLAISSTGDLFQTFMQVPKITYNYSVYDVRREAAGGLLTNISTV